MQTNKSPYMEIYIHIYTHIYTRHRHASKRRNIIYYVSIFSIYIYRLYMLNNAWFMYLNVTMIPDLPLD